MSEKKESKEKDKVLSSDEEIRGKVIWIAAALVGIDGLKTIEPNPNIGKIIELAVDIAEIAGYEVKKNSDKIRDSSDPDKAAEAYVRATIADLERRGL